VLLRVHRGRGGTALGSSIKTDERREAHGRKSKNNVRFFWWIGTYGSPVAGRCRHSQIATSSSINEQSHPNPRQASSMVDYLLERICFSIEPVFVIAFALCSYDSMFPHGPRLSASRNNGPVQLPYFTIPGRNIPSRRRQSVSRTAFAKLAIPYLSFDRTKPFSPSVVSWEVEVTESAEV